LKQSSHLVHLSIAGGGYNSEVRGGRFSVEFDTKLCHVRRAFDRFTVALRYKWQTVIYSR